MFLVRFSEKWGGAYFALANLMFWASRHQHLEKILKIRIRMRYEARGGSSRWKEEGPKLLTEHGGPGDRALGVGLQGCSAPLPREILHFWAQFVQFGAYFLPTLYWKYLDLFPMKILYFFNYGRTIWKWIIYPAHASPSLSPSETNSHCRSPFTLGHHLPRANFKKITSVC